MSLDQVLKIAQIAFYLLAGTVAILTFVSAKKGLLRLAIQEYMESFNPLSGTLK